jgi:hypothetical protein
MMKLYKKFSAVRVYPFGERGERRGVSVAAHAELIKSRRASNVVYARYFGHDKTRAAFRPLLVVGGHFRRRRAVEAAETHHHRRHNQTVFYLAVSDCERRKKRFKSHKKTSFFIFFILKITRRKPFADLSGAASGTRLYSRVFRQKFRRIFKPRPRFLFLFTQKSPPLFRAVPYGFPASLFKKPRYFCFKLYNKKIPRSFFSPSCRRESRLAKFAFSRLHYARILCFYKGFSRIKPVFLIA